MSATETLLDTLQTVASGETTDERTDNLKGVTSDIGDEADLEALKNDAAALKVLLDDSYDQVVNSASDLYEPDWEFRRHPTWPAGETTAGNPRFMQSAAAGSLISADVYQANGVYKLRFLYNVYGQRA